MHCGRFGRTKTNFANKLETKRYEKTITGNNIGCMRHYDARHPIDESTADLQSSDEGNLFGFFSNRGSTPYRRSIIALSACDWRMAKKH